MKMNKKLILVICIAIFLAGFTFNVSTVKEYENNELSLSSLIKKSLAQTEEEEEEEEESMVPWLNDDGTNTTYVKGPWGKNWNEYRITCTYSNTTTTTTNNFSTDYSGTVSANIKIPGTPLTASTTASYNTYTQSSTTTTYSTNSITIEKIICGYGSGSCWPSAPSGNPCV